MISSSVLETTTSLYDASPTSVSHFEDSENSTIPFRTGRALVPVAALLASSLHLSDVIPAQPVDRDTVRTIVEPYTRGQILNAQRQDIKMIKEVRKFASYPQGWDGFNGVPPSRKAIDEAERFISMITKNQILEPYISLAADGEINFYWKNNKFLLDVGFFGEEVYSLYAKMASGEEIIKDDLRLTDPVPEEIAPLIIA
jgi:hypothetical protein